MVVLYSFTLLLSASLFFLIEPLLAKMVLPLLGGTPAVWNTCMMYFQAVMLAGYLYVHFTSRFLTPKKQAVLQIALLSLALSALPIMVETQWGLTINSPISWLIVTLLIASGLPLLLVSASAPMLQRWFAHSSNQDPYFLYAVSNVGSLLALLAFPFFIEPNFTLTEQSRAWLYGYVGLILLTMVCASALIFRHRTNKSEVNNHTVCDEIQILQAKVSWKMRGYWLLLSFAPSSLLLGTTTYLTTDIAAVPLFWVVPLALYLATFIIAFSRNPLISSTFALKAQFIMLFPFIFLLSFPDYIYVTWVIFSIHLATFFFTALVCHGELARCKPTANELTEFYLWIAIGGLLGGVFNTLIAPKLFTAVIEYPLILGIACMLRPELIAYPKALSRKFFGWSDVIIPLGIFASLSLVSMLLITHSFSMAANSRLYLFSFFAVGVFVFSENSKRFGLCLIALTLGILCYSNAYSNKKIYTLRNFFGTIKVYEDKVAHVNVLTHGSTLHSAQSTELEKSKNILSYYRPLNDIFQVFYKTTPALSVAIAGLGAGTTACYARPQDQFTFYEIDPDMVALATNPRYFSYLTQCVKTKHIELGDARLNLMKAADLSYHLIILDAFSSDSIPVHLLTREAILLYLKKLAPHGILVFHISNKYLDLQKVLAKSSNELGLVAKVYLTDKNKLGPYIYRSKWLLMAREFQDFGELENNKEWVDVSDHKTGSIWTDNYSNILSAMAL